MKKARVFISCGQRNKRERKIGAAIKNYFEERKFEAYFAAHTHCSDALTENIFKFLRKSEYFVFIDFKREKRKKGKSRGSLFVNQEIAIATFLGLTGIGFHERGVRREGILDYHIYQPFPFKTKADIILTLEKETEHWDPTSTNELDMIYDKNTLTRNINYDFGLFQGKGIGDFYPLQILNCNKNNHAFSCSAYVTQIKNLDSKEEFGVANRELKWEGTGLHLVNIRSGTRRGFTAFYVDRTKNIIKFIQPGLDTDNPNLRLRSLSQGKYLLEYTVISLNFEKVSRKYIVEFEGSVDNIKFYPEIKTHNKASMKTRVKE